MIEPRNKRGEHEVCRWSLAGSNDGHEWVELHAGAWGLQQDSFYSSPVSGVCTVSPYISLYLPISPCISFYSSPVSVGLGLGLAVGLALGLWLGLGLGLGLALTMP